MSVQLSIDHDQMHFAPGDTVRGRVEWSLSEPPERATVSLVIFTVGKGDQDIRVLHSVDLGAPRAVGEQVFEMPLPAGPLSFAGTLISLRWAVEVNLEPEGADRREITLAIGEQEIQLEAVEPDSVAAEFFEKFSAQSP